MIWKISSMPAPAGPRPIRTRTSPGPDRPLALPFDRGDRVALAREDPRRPGLAIDAVRVDHARVDRRALDHRAARGEVPARERDGAREPLLPGPARAHDHVVGIDAVLLEQIAREAASAARSFPTTRARAPAARPSR